MHLNGPVLVLNGDTLPLYSLQELIVAHELLEHPWATAATARVNKHPTFAGAVVLSPEAVEEIKGDTRTYDFAACLFNSERHWVSGFLDVGTPEGFRQAQEFKE